eukprot:1148196-Pelagomonas_calceolata.AAC.4
MLGTTVPSAGTRDCLPSTVSEAVHGPIYAALAPQEEPAPGPDQRGDDDREGPRGGANPIPPPAEPMPQQPPPQGPAASSVGV